MIRQSQTLNIDELEIPASKVKAQTFEELLELKLQQEGQPMSQPVAPAEEPKRQFLKRKTQAVKPDEVSTKKYSYYADAFKRDSAEKEDLTDNKKSKEVPPPKPWQVKDQKKPF